MPAFLQGIPLCGKFYEEAVRPILARNFPALRYSAALIGSGSDVLGFDTEMSTDHDWGPRLLLFLSEADNASLAETIRETLSQQLPASFMGFPTGFAPNSDGTGRLVEADCGAIPHRVQTVTIPTFFQSTLNFDVQGQIEPADWLTFPEQKLRSLTGGAVYHDDLGLEAERARFAYYPQDVWLYLLAAGWTRIGQEEHLMGRAGFVGDEIGSALIAASLVRDLMRLGFLMEKQYAPYPKWFGTAFRQLACAAELEPALRRALAAETWKERENFLVVAYEFLAQKHNALGITEPLPVSVASFFDRPFRVIHLHADFAGAIRQQIQDPAVKRLAERRLIGGIDQWSDSTDLLSDTGWRTIVRQLYE